MSDLMQALYERKPLPSWAPPPAPYPLPTGEYPTAKWPAGLTHLPQRESSQRSHEFKSESLGATVRVVFDLDREPLYYQHGTVKVDLEVLEIWHAGWECGQHLDSTAINCVEKELARELKL